MRLRCCGLCVAVWLMARKAQFVGGLARKNKLAERGGFEPPVEL
jgi:hypothetical protein